jgi:hypothetical protein
MRKHLSRMQPTGIAVSVDRRAFIATGAALCGASLLPLSAVIAASPVAARPLSDWTIDDMWGVYPRYADPIGYGRRRSDDVIAADPVDAAFVA